MRFRSAFFGAAAVALTFPAVSRAADSISLTVGRSQILRPSRAVGTIAVGDPDIADATTAAGNTILITAKKVGTTNIIALDETGAEVLASTLRIIPVDRRPKYTVNVIKGGQDVEYSCGPEPRCTRTKDRVRESSETIVLERPSRGPAAGATTTVESRSGSRPDSE